MGNVGIARRNQCDFKNYLESNQRRFGGGANKKKNKGKGDCAVRIATKVHEWTSPDTAIVYAYEEDGEETGKTVRVDFLFTLKFDDAGKLKIVKTRQLSEEESQKYQKDSQN